MSQRRTARPQGRSIHRALLVAPEALEPRRLLAATTTYVNDNWHFLADVDTSGSLTAGDFLRNDNDTINPATITVTYGTDGFGTVTTGSFTGSFAGSATINDAITNTTVNGVANVLEGTYGELVTANKTLRLRGAQFGVDARTRSGVAETVIRGADLGVGIRSTSFFVSANDVVIDGFVVQDNTSGGQFGGGIVLGSATSGSEVRNNIIQDNITGLLLANNNAANPATIERNLFRNNNQPGSTTGTGIYSDQFVAGGTLSSVVIANNTFTGHTSGGLGQGITLSSTNAAAPATNIFIADNLFDANSRALVAFNLTASAIEDNTMRNSASAISADIRLFEGVNDLTITRNVLENGAGRALRISNVGTGLPDATDVTFQLNSVSGYTGPVGTFEVDAGSYAGTLDATCNWWGDITGPTIASNPGGAGQTIADPDGVVDFQPWLVYAPDADAAAPGVQFVASFAVPAQTSGFTTTNNNYRRLVNAIDCLQPGQTATLSGTFDWTEANAAAAWALGNDGVSANLDDYTLTVPPDVNNITLTAASLGSARIQGPGDLAAQNLERFLDFDGGDNQGWTISNLEIFDFDLSIGMFNGLGGADAYDGTAIVNNLIRVPADLNTTVAPNDVNQNIGIHFSFGANQTIANNEIQLAGNGVSDSANSRLAQSVGMQSNVSGGDVYDGLLIDNNTLRVLNAQSVDPETILGIWENAHAHASNITVSNNDFINDAVGNVAADNRQRAFRVTSHSSATTVVAYTGNTADGANIGFEWLALSNFAGNQPVRLAENTLTNNATGVLVQSNGSANLYRNTITGSGAGGGVHVMTGSLAAAGSVTHGAAENFISGGSGDGIRIDATAGAIGSIFDNDLGGNSGFGVNNLAAASVTAEFNWWGTAAAAGVAGEVNGPVDFTPWLTTGTDTQAGTAGFQGDLGQLGVGTGGDADDGLDDVIRIDRNESDSNIEVYVNGTLVFAGTPTALGVDGSDDSDQFIVDFTGGGNPIPTGGLALNGRGDTSGPGDSLTVDGGTFTNVTFNHAPAGADGNVGSIALGSSSTINYTGLEPITLDLSSAPTIVTINLPDDGIDNLAVLEDDGNLANGMVRLRSGNGTFETTTFTNPTFDTRVNASDDGETMTLARLDNAFAAFADFFGSTGNDTYVLDFSSGVNVIPTVGPNQSAFVGAAGTDTVNIIGGFTPTNVDYTFGDIQGLDLGPQAGTISIDGRAVSYQGVEPAGGITDGLVSTNRSFTFDSGLAGSKVVTIADDATAANSRSRLSTDAATGTPPVDFRHPTTALTVNGSDSAETMNLSGLDSANRPTTLRLNGLVGGAPPGAADAGDTFNVTPLTTTAVVVDGDRPSPAEAAPRDTLNVNFTGTTTPGLTTMSTADGFSGTYTFGNRQPVSFQEIETFSSLPPGSSLFSIGDVSKHEGHNNARKFTFTVTRTSGVGTASVQFTTASGSATAGSDYVTLTGTVTFNPGQTSRNVQIDVNGDRDFEPDETFFVNLSSPVNGAISDGQGVGTIENDDKAPSSSSLVALVGTSTASAWLKTELVEDPIADELVVDATGR